MTTQRRCARSWRRGGLAWVCAAALVAAMCVPHAASAEKKYDEKTEKKLEEQSALAIASFFKLLRAHSNTDIDPKETKEKIESMCKETRSFLEELGKNPASLIPYLYRIVESSFDAIRPLCVAIENWDKLLAPHLTKEALAPSQAALNNVSVMAESFKNNSRILISSLANISLLTLNEAYHSVILATEEKAQKIINQTDFKALAERASDMRQGKIKTSDTLNIESGILKIFKTKIEKFFNSVKPSSPSTSSKRAPKPKPKPSPASKPDPIPMPNLTQIRIAAQQRKNRSPASVKGKNSKMSSDHTNLVAAMCIGAILIGVVVIAASIWWRRRTARNAARSRFFLMHDTSGGELEAVEVNRGGRALLTLISASGFN